MRKKIEFLVLILLLAGLIVASRNIGKYVSSDNVNQGKKTVVIDAGHGSADPGKVGVNDALEKDINLKISKKVKKLLKAKNIEVVMTREDDRSLSKEGDANKKIQDLKARVALINETKPQLVVSIHQNSYHEESVHGAQVFYFAHSKESENAAVILQDALLSVDKENTRQAKANESYYLLKRTEVPIIIVECGFLSNKEEADKLITKDYQKSLAEAIAKGIETCLTQ